MSLPRGSHSNCGSQPSGWEPFFFTPCSVCREAQLTAWILPPAANDASSAFQRAFNNLSVRFPNVHSTVSF